MPLKSFIHVPPDSDFPIQNLPYGIFRPRDGAARAGVAIGDLILDLSVLEERGFFSDVAAAAVASGRTRNLPPETAAATTLFAGDSLNTFMALGRPAWTKTRAILQNLLSADNRRFTRQHRIACARISQTKRGDDATSRAHRRLH